MKFFVPSIDESQAEQVWAHARQWLSGLGLDTTRRRIRALACEIDGKDHFLSVGDDVPSEEDGPVLVILNRATPASSKPVLSQSKGLHARPRHRRRHPLPDVPRRELAGGGFLRGGVWVCLSRRLSMPLA